MTFQVVRNSLLRKNNIKKAICGTSLLSAVILIIVLTDPPIIYGLENSNNPFSSQKILTIAAATASTNPKPVLLDPNPSLIDTSGNLKNNDITTAANIKAIRSGTVADGVSKLLVLVPHSSKLQFSIKDQMPDNLIDGTLAPLISSGGGGGSTPLSRSLSSSATVDSQRTSNGDSVVIAVYTPPSSFGQLKVDHKTIKVVVSDPNDPSFGAIEVPIQLHKPPIVLVHGIWEDPNNTWIDTNFKNTLENNGFKVYFADYTTHNAETFDPYAIPKIGNHGIDSVNKTISKILKDYHLRSIADSQVDVVGHSMGGLMARGYIQQSYYKNENNYMKGYVHRLITIGTPHFGAPLSKILHDFRNDVYCYDPSTQIFTSFVCIPNPFFPDLQLMDLTTIFDTEYNLPIDKGGVDALISNSSAYSHMCPTNVRSYAIVGVWEPADTNSHSDQQLLFRAITGRIEFDIDTDVFHGQNDLLVNVNSQAGGLQSTPVHPGQPLPDKSALYHNTIHAIDPLASHDMAETNSPSIQHDVAILLSSPDNKFSDLIGAGSTCHIPISP